jgi:hypothetical protein
VLVLQDAAYRKKGQEFIKKAFLIVFMIGRSNCLGDRKRLTEDVVIPLLF